MNDSQVSSGLTQLAALLWSSDETTQLAIWLVLGVALIAIAFVYAPLMVRLVRIGMLDRAIRTACQIDDRPGREHREEIAVAFNLSPLSWHWEEFVYRWRSALLDAARQRSPVRLIEVLDERPLLPTGARRSLLPALPGIFLAVGVLGTFAGLTVALGNDAFGLVDADPAAVTRLVGVQVGLALRTSLWGLVLAIGALTAGRLIQGSFERYGESLDQWVERAYGSIAPGELTQLAANAQRESLENLGGELTRFSNDLSERLDRGLQRIEHSTASAAGLISEEQRGVLQSIVRELSLQIQQGVEQHLGSLHDLLERSIDHQGSVTGGLAETFDLMANNSAIHTRVTETLEQAAHTVQLAAAQMSGTAKEFTPVLERLQDTGVALYGTATTMESTQAIVERSAQGMREALENAAAALNEQHVFIENGIGEIRATVDAMSRGLGENLTQALRSVDDALSHTIGRLRETITESNETIDRMTGPVRAAEGTTREMHTALERVRSELMGLGEWLTQAIKPMRHTLTQLEDKTGDITRALTDFGDNTHNVDKTMDALRSEIHDEGRRFRTSTSELVRHLQQASSSISALERSASDPLRSASDPPRSASDPTPSAAFEVDAASSLRASGSRSAAREAPPVLEQRAVPSERTAPVATELEAGESSITASEPGHEVAARPEPSAGMRAPALDPLPRNAGRALGPDPYARLEQSRGATPPEPDSSHPAWQIETGSTTDPSGPEDLSLSGLLGARPSSGATSARGGEAGTNHAPRDQRAGPAEEPSDTSASTQSASDEQPSVATGVDEPRGGDENSGSDGSRGTDEGSGADERSRAETPRTWRFLGKE